MTSPLLTRPLPTLRRCRALAGALACAGALAALPARAAPEPPQDAVMTLLAERGLLPAGAPALVQSVRDKASELVLAAMNFLGVPYRRGGNSAEQGFDCSGFTRHIFAMSLGQMLPRRADEQARAPGLVAVQREELRPGDLVFFNTLRRSFSHVGIYIGDGRFIHSPRTGSEVRIEDMRQGYWDRRFNGARRTELAQLTPAADPAATPAAATAAE